MIGKKDSNCIFEQYCGIIREQSDDLLTQVKKSALDPKVKQQLIALLSDPSVAAKWKGGDADTVNAPDVEFGKELSTAKYGAPDQDTANAPDPNFAREMAAARKAQEDAYPESEVKKFLGEDEEEPMPTEAPWWVPGELGKKRWLSNKQAQWRQDRKKSEEESEEGYADPASFFSGGAPISELGPMKFEPRVAPKVKTPQEKAEEEAYWAAKEQVNQERKQAARDLAAANRKKTTTVSSSDPIKTGKGVHPMFNRKVTDADYNQKKAEYLAALAAVGGGN